jgi:hypothetical protein
LALVNRIEVTGVRQDRAHRRQLAESLHLIGRDDPTIASQLGAGTAVAVLDTGVDFTRAAFGSCGPGPQPTGDGCQVAYARDFTPFDDGQLDDGVADACAIPGECHGTNVGGIVLGVAPATKILALDVFDGDEAQDSVINAAVNWVIGTRATYNTVAMNLSLGFPIWATSTCWDSPEAAAFAGARAVGIVPVVAAGNSAADFGGFTPGISTPACTPGAVSVGAVYDADLGSDPFGCGDATTAPDKVTCFSETASILTLLAPGALIEAAGITMGGTSQATPHVAGAVAVLKAAKPTATPYQIERVLATSGDLVIDERPEPDITKRRLDLPQLLAAPLPAQPIFAEPPLTVAGSPTWSLGQSLARTGSGVSERLHNVHMRWTGTRRQVDYQRSSNHGATWSNPKRVSRTDHHGDFAAVAAAGNYVYAVWTSVSQPYSFTAARALWFASSSDKGTTWTAPRRLTSSTGRIDTPSVAASGAYVYLGWTDSNTGNVKFMRSSNYGASFLAAVNIGTTTNTFADGRWGYPRLAAAGANVIVAWNASGASAMRARVSTNRGAGWAAAISLDTDGFSKAYVAALGQRLAVVWTDLNTSGSGATRLKIWQSGVWQATRVVATMTSSGTYKVGYDPAVALVGTGGVGVAWTGCRRSDCRAPTTIGNDLRVAGVQQQRRDLEVRGAPHRFTYHVLETHQ